MKNRPVDLRKRTESIAQVGRTPPDLSTAAFGSGRVETRRRGPIAVQTAVPALLLMLPAPRKFLPIQDWRRPLGSCDVTDV
jgi:hypothetical protein